jgi:membrane-associated phospholipid phosphatase
MQFAYSCFYWMMPVLGLVLAFGHSRDHLIRYLGALCLTFYACNFLFLFLPALGPASLHGVSFAYPGGFFTDMMHFLYRFEIPGGHFPSSHVALTVVVLHYSLLMLKAKSILFWILGLSLIFSTVYCGYHYAVDVVGGLALAYVVIAAVEMLEQRARK